MQTSFIKKIITVAELQDLFTDVSEYHKDYAEKYGHVLDLKHDLKLMLKSFSHEALLTWNTHVWGHFNGEKWDGLFIGIIRKSEKFNKKVMEEYLWVSTNSNSGIKLYSTAAKFAEQNNCDYISMAITLNNPSSPKLEKLYKALGYEKDSVIFYKKLKN